MSMIKYYINNRSKSVMLSQHFSTKSFMCKCDECRSNKDTTFPIDDELIKKLEQFYCYGITKVSIISGYRCKAHNVAVGGSSKSKHKLGRAADIQLSKNGKRLSVADHCCLAQLINFTGIGAMKNTIHVDTRDNKLWFDETKLNSSGSYLKTNDFFNYYKVDRDEFNKKYPYTGILANSSGSYNVVIDEFSLSAINTTSAVFSVKVAENFKDYEWCYLLNNNEHRLDSIDSVNSAITISNLKSDQEYTIQLYAVSRGNTETVDADVEVTYDEAEELSAVITFRTLPSYPSKIENLKFIIEQKKNLLDSICKLSFKPPNRWGSFAGDKGYEIFLTVNGRISRDRYLQVPDSSKTVAFTLKDFVGHTDIKYCDQIRVGVRPFIENEHGRFFNKDNIVYSQPICLQCTGKKISKIWIDINKKFKRAILHNMSHEG